jgi:ElaB/YqjD/DUF883 family membrane-anchored ribosome-binding protein
MGMADRHIAEGTWNELKDKLRQRWSQLSEQDLPQAAGTLDEVVGVIQRKTGEARELIERQLQEMTEEGRAAVNRMRDYTQHTARQAWDQVRDGYAEAEHYVRDRPAQSLAVCFGAGLIVGLAIGLMLRSK